MRKFDKTGKASFTPNTLVGRRSNSNFHLQIPLFWHALLKATLKNDREVKQSPAYKALASATEWVTSR